jgi:hypothetical protein
MHDPSFVAARLGRLTGKAVALAVTDNTTRMLSATTKDGEVRVRLHRIFLQAENEVLDAIAGFISGEKKSRVLIRDFVTRHGRSIVRRHAAPPVLRQLGTFHCLSDIFGRLNREYFDGRISAGITWGRNRCRRRPRRMTLGSYCSSTDVIRISPLLDRRSVPFFFVEFIVYHEMLHADLFVATERGRRRLHTKEFRIRERQFISYEKAIAWEKKNL